MAVSTSTTSIPNINFGQFFQRGATPTTASQPSRPGFFSRMWRGTQNIIYAPARHATEEAAQGFANRVTELFTGNQDEIINRVRHVFTEALLRRCPEQLHLLLGHLQTFLINPTQADLDQIKQLLDRIDAPGIRSIAPSLNDTGINQLTSLRAMLNTEITLQATGLVVSENARLQLLTAEGILEMIIENHEGALLQTINHLTQSLGEPNGFFQSIRQQLNHPQHGVIAEGLATLRQHLNGRAFAPLRQSKEACENYRSALSRNANPAELSSLRQNLQQKLGQLLAQRTSVPQISAENWRGLEEFDTRLQNHALPTVPSDAAFQILADSFNAQRGMIEEAADLMIEGITRSFSHLGNIVQNAISPPPATSVTSAPPPTQPNPPPPGENVINVSTIAAQGRRFLDSILASTGSALSQQGAKSLASLLRYIFEKIRDHIRQGPLEQQHLLNTIDPMIQRLQGAMENRPWGELTGVLVDALQFMQNSQVYLQGLRLPLNPVRTHVSAIPDFLQNINAHQNAMRLPSERTPTRISDNEIEQKAALLQKRASSYGLAKLILEKFCGYEGNDKMYADIYKANEISENELSDTFRTRLFGKIDQANQGVFGIFIKWSAKITYDLFLPISSFYTNSIFGNLLDFIKKGIVTSPTGGRESKEEFFVRIARSWLAVTSGAYNQVATMPVSQARDFNQMMEEAIKMPERNGGLKQNELFAAAAKTVLDAFGPRIKWDETVDQHFQTQIPTSSPLHFLNPLVLGLNVFCSFCLKGLLFIPQWVGNFFLQNGAKIAFSSMPLLQDYTDQAIESLRRNTPASYATQRVLYRQLQKVLQALQQGLGEEANNAGGLLSRDSNIKRVEIAGLVEYLMEVLNKSQYRTQDRLNDYLHHRAPLRDRAGRELDDTFIPEVMETVVMTISVSLSAITQEDEMRRMLFDGLSIANEMFDERQPVTDADFAAVERGIKELTDQVLETAIQYAIDEKFDFTNEKQKRGIAHFVRTLKAQSNAFALQMDQLSGEVASDTVNPTQLLTKISSMIEHSSRFNRDRVDALGNADGNRNFHTETKHHLNEMSRQLLTHCNPLASRLNTMKTHADQVAFRDRLLQPLLLHTHVCQMLDNPLQNESISAQDLNFCKTQLALFRQHLSTLQRHHCPAPMTDEIRRHLQEFTAAIQKIEESKKTEEVFRSAYQIFSALKNAKLTAFENPSATDARYHERQLVSAIRSLPDEQKNALNQAILNLMTARSPAEVETASSLFHFLHIQFGARNFVQETQSLAILRQTKGSMQTHVTQAIQEFAHQVALDKAAIRQNANELTNQVRALNGWAQTQHELPIWNLFIFDMQWVTETVKNLAFDRAQGKIKRLFESLYQKHNYIGLIHQGVLLPFLEKFGKHHLRQ